MREIQFMLQNGPITSFIVLICSVLYIVSLLLAKEHGKTETAIKLGALIPQEGQIWRLVSANFVHVDLLHYLFNMFFLIDLGSQLECRMTLDLYLILMMLSGLFSTGLTFIYDRFKHLDHITFGASGFCFGILGFLAGTMLFSNAIDASYMRPFISMIVINLIYTLSQPQISKTGHFGGFVAGLLVSLI